jgi:hypothetical protein
MTITTAFAFAPIIYRHQDHLDQWQQQASFNVNLRPALRLRRRRGLAALSITSAAAEQRLGLASRTPRFVFLFFRRRC